MLSGSVPRHRKALPKAAVRKNSLQVWMIAVSVLNKTLWAGDKELCSNVLGMWGDNNPFS
jgi:hypothetical protein